TAEHVFDQLSESDWLEAFAGHPRIGERGDETADREQSGAAGVDESTREGLAEANRSYEDRFGFTYIVYATGKSGAEMLDIARRRLGSSRAQEIAVASAEQRKITATRLGRMLCQEVS
ncbi:MAG: 2-oxo-4-hydroxy-4-carboxy-5-ureidoimidazoline decarboxylase, partial [Acidimicrobiia bacterium]